MSLTLLSLWLTSSWQKQLAAARIAVGACAAHNCLRTRSMLPLHCANAHGHTKHLGTLVLNMFYDGWVAACHYCGLKRVSTVTHSCMSTTTMQSLVM